MVADRDSHVAVSPSYELVQMARQDPGSYSIPSYHHQPMITRIIAQFVIPGNNYAGGCVGSAVTFTMSEDRNPREVDILLDYLLTGRSVHCPERIGVFD